jgi:hypothetical protein
MSSASINTNTVPRKGIFSDEQSQAENAAAHEQMIKY